MLDIFSYLVMETNLKYKKISIRNVNLISNIVKITGVYCKLRIKFFFINIK